MKQIRQMAIALLLLGMMQTAYSQTKVVRVYPKHGTIVATLTKPKVVVFKNKRYFFTDGVWYRSARRGYRVCAAPVGLRLKALPAGHKVVIVRGKKYFRYKGITYQKRRGHFYVVTV